MKYMIYDVYHTDEKAKALLTSSYELFKQLKLEVLPTPQPFKYYGGYWARMSEPDELIYAMGYNLAFADSQEAILVFLEEDAYANAVYAKTRIEGDVQVMQNLQTHLAPLGLKYDSKVQMAYLPDLLNSLDFFHLITRRFSAFSSVILKGGYQGHLPKTTNHRIYEAIQLECIDTPLAHQYYTHLLSINPTSALYNGAKLFFDMADLGVDFVLSYSLSQFYMLDSKRKQMCKAYNRDDIVLPILFLPQVLLLAFGVLEHHQLGFVYHENKIRIF
uniref:HdrB-like C-terminal domain-containing protein n=1 Tax=uncultured Helicobacter sp. TaxID=175537 RepID=A0A650EMR1_9HELI|nr:hypothetical protein Helico5904_1200 [uncultured Helicobacter sp.]